MAVTGLVRSGRPIDSENRVAWENPHTRAKMRALVAILESQLMQISREGALAVASELPLYKQIPLEDIEQSVLRNVRRVIQALLEARPPSAAEVAEASVARTRCDQGLPIEDCIQAYRISLREIRNLFLEIAADLAMDPGDINTAIYILWDTTDVVTAQLALVHHETLIERTLHDERQRTEFIQGVVQGNLALPRLRLLASIYNTELDLRYRVIRGRPAAGVGLAAFVRALEIAGSSPYGQALLCTYDDSVIGLVSQRPDIAPHLGIVGIGSMATISSAPVSFQEANQLLEVANRLGKSGCIDRDSLSWRLALVSEPEIGDLLVDRYLKPMWDLGDFGTVILDSMREYLACGRHLTQAARKLHIHVNSLRYRIERFEAVTGRNVDDADVTLELHWAIERAALAGSGNAACVPPSASKPESTGG